MSEDAEVVNIHAAKTQLSRLLKRVAAGEEIVIAKAGKPVAHLVPVEAPPVDRVPGTAGRDLWVLKEFYEPLGMDATLRSREGGSSSGGAGPREEDAL